MKIRPITIAIVLATAISSCTVDTYPLPEETLTGKLICPDGTNLITEQPNGFKIRMNEIVDGKIADIPQDFWGKADGTFRNTRIFEGSYIVQHCKHQLRGNPLSDHLVRHHQQRARHYRTFQDSESRQCWQNKQGKTACLEVESQCRYESG